MCFKAFIHSLQHAVTAACIMHSHAAAMQGTAELQSSWGTLCALWFTLAAQASDLASSTALIEYEPQRLPALSDSLAILLCIWHIRLSSSLMRTQPASAPTPKLLASRNMHAFSSALASPSYPASTMLIHTGAHPRKSLKLCSPHAPFCYQH